MVEYQSLDFVERDDVTIVRCRESKIQDPTLVQEWTDELFDLVERQEHKRIVFNLSNIHFLGSAALNKLVVLNKNLKKAGGKLVLAEIRGPIRDLFAVTNLDRLLPLADSEESGVEMCRTDGQGN